MMETLWKNNPNFVKDAPMIYVNFIVIVNIVSEKQNKRHDFLTDLRTLKSFWVQILKEKISFLVDCPTIDDHYIIGGLVTHHR